MSTKFQMPIDMGGNKILSVAVPTLTTDAATKGYVDAGYSPLGHTHDFASLTSKPATLSGYGITDPVMTLDTVQTVTGMKTFIGNPGLIVDGGAVSGTIVFNAPAGFTRQMIFRTASVNRWTIGANATAESGGNAGSNFVFTSYDDSGASLSNVMYMRRNGQVGINTVPLARLHVVESDAATAAVSTVVIEEHSSSGIPTVGFGARSRVQMHSSTNTTRSAFDRDVIWITATDASRKARVVFNVYDTLAREALRIEASGAAPMVGFLGATAAVRQTLPIAATNAATTQALANSLRDALITFGLGV